MLRLPETRTLYRQRIFRQGVLDTPKIERLRGRALREFWQKVGATAMDVMVPTATILELPQGQGERSCHRCQRHSLPHGGACGATLSTRSTWRLQRRGCSQDQALHSAS